jgi:hypothetical protein
VGLAHKFPRCVPALSGGENLLLASRKVCRDLISGMKTKAEHRTRLARDATRAEAANRRDLLSRRKMTGHLGSESSDPVKNVCLAMRGAHR